MFYTIEGEILLTNSFKEAMITLLLKPHKDTTKKENYRPKFLISIEAKIKYLQSKSKNTRKIINDDQEGFIPEKQGWFNI